MQKEIANFPGYYITTEGQVQSAKTQQFLKPFETNGYLRIVLSKNGEQTKFRIHRLVAEAFIPNPNNLPEINHKDENKHNNNVNNLEQVTSKQNNNYSTHNERMATTKQKEIIMCDKENLEPIREFKSIKEAAEFLNKKGGQSNICLALKGKIKTAYGYKQQYKNN